jgi:hypothetical protein
MKEIYLIYEKKVFCKVPLSRELTNDEIDKLKDCTTMFELEDYLVKWEEEDVEEEDHSGKLEYITVDEDDTENSIVLQESCF